MVYPTNGAKPFIQENGPASSLEDCRSQIRALMPRYWTGEMQEPPRDPEALLSFPTNTLLKNCFEKPGE